MPDLFYLTKFVEPCQILLMNLKPIALVVEKERDADGKVLMELRLC